jgi:hypothetical protein
MAGTAGGAAFVAAAFATGAVVDAAGGAEEVAPQAGAALPAGAGVRFEVANGGTPSAGWVQASFAFGEGWIVPSLIFT